MYCIVSCYLPEFSPCTYPIDDAYVNVHSVPNTESDFTQEMKTKRKLVVAHKEIYSDFNSVMKLQSLNESPQLPDNVQKPNASSTSKLLETPYSVTKINGPFNQTPTECNNNKQCPEGKSTSHLKTKTNG